MKSELKALAKQSFVEEFDMWKHTSTVRQQHANASESDSLDGKSIGQLEQEIRYLQQVVEGIQQTQSPLNWSSPLVRDQMSFTHPITPHAHTPQQTQSLPSSPTRAPRSPGLFPETVLDGDQNPLGNNFFILSSAPLGNFDSLIQPQLHSNQGHTGGGSLLEQAHRFAELNALFQMPNMAEEESWFSKQFSDYHAQAEAQRIRNRDMQRLHKLRQESELRQHKERLEKA
ncbi:hypothetical protein EON64_17795, partial [archaeon]